MSTRIVVAAALSLVITAAAFEPVAAESSRKCRPTANPRFPEAPEVVYVVDQQVADSASLPAVDKDSVSHIEIMCTDELYERYGVKTRANAVVIFTRPGARRLLQTALDSVAMRQQTHLEKHGSFARTLSELGWHDPSRNVRIELTVSDDGGRWSAAGRHEALPRASEPLIVSGERAGG